MYAVSFIDSNNKVNLKGGFKSDKEAYSWIDEHSEITPVKLLVWSDCIDCYDTYKVF